MSGDADGGAPDRQRTDGKGPDGSRERMEDAITEIRREGWKAAVLTGVVYGTVAFLAVNLLLAALGPSWLPDRLRVPASLTEAVGSVVGTDLGTLAVPGTATVAVGVGLLAFAAVVWLRVRKPLVEQFEAVNPVVAEKLRTARDAVEADADSRMARRLYAEVLADLRESSAFGLVSVGRLGATVVVIVALSLATLQVAVVDLALLDRPAAAADDGANERPQNYTGLLDGEEVLGDREEVSAGDQNQTAELESSGGGREVDEDRTFPEQQQSGVSGGGSSGVDSQQAEFASPEEVEDAELVREYNRQIRDQGGSGESGDGADGEDDEESE